MTQTKVNMTLENLLKVESLSSSLSIGHKTDNYLSLSSFYLHYEIYRSFKTFIVIDPRVRDVRIGSKLGQISHKLEKSRTFNSQFSVYFGYDISDYETFNYYKTENWFYYTTWQ